MTIGPVLAVIRLQPQREFRFSNISAECQFRVSWSDSDLKKWWIRDRDLVGRVRFSCSLVPSPNKICASILFESVIECHISL